MSNFISTPPAPTTSDSETAVSKRHLEPHVLKEKPPHTATDAAAFQTPERVSDPSLYPPPCAPRKPSKPRSNSNTDDSIGIEDSRNDVDFGHSVRLSDYFEFEKHLEFEGQIKEPEHQQKQPEPLTLVCKCIHPDARPVTRGTPYAAGMDVYSPVDTELAPGEQKLVPSGLQIGWTGTDAHLYYVQIAPRSGMCYKQCVTPMAGVIDYDYRGEVGVLLYNYGTSPVQIQKGMRIAQLVMHRIEMPQIVESDVLPDVVGRDNERGKNGFGSTGL